jgi:hypothetical protein
VVKVPEVALIGLLEQPAPPTVGFSVVAQQSPLDNTAALPSPVLVIVPETEAE